MTEALKGESKYPHINKGYVKNEEKLKSDCATYFTTGMAGKFPYMLQWMQNINMIAGNQWLYFNPQKKMFEIDPNLEDESRVTINKILPAYRTAVGSLLRDRMTAKIIQQNSDEQEIDAAKVKTRLLEHINRVNRFMDTLKESIEWAALCGKGVRKKWWDPDEQKIVDEVIQTFEFVAPSNVRKMSKMPWVCHARYETVEWVYENYGIDLSDTNKKEKITRGTADYGQYGSFLAAVKHIMEDGFFTGLAPTATFNNVMVKEFWFRPNSEYPDGLLAIFLNDELIFADRNPISGKLDPKKKRRDFYFPFNEMDFFDLPFRYWPMSLVESVIGMQQYYNQFMSDAIENFKYAGAPVMVGPDGAVNQDEVIIRPGQYIGYNAAMGGSAPSFQNPTPIQPAMFEVMNQLASAIGEQVGIHQFGRGMMPPGIHAAAALAIINEQDQITKMGLTINLENFISTDAEQTLYLVKKYWPDQFMIRYLGDENRWEVEEFDKSKYHIGDEEIVIESKQELAQDKMTRFDQVLKLMTTPRVDNPQEPVLDTNTGLRILDLEKEMSTVSLRDLNWNMAKQENETMAGGKRVMALQYEDHKLHIEAHMQYMLRVEFKDLKENIRNLFLEHWQQHMQMMNGSQQNAGAQASQTEQQQMPMQGQMPMGQQMPQMGPQMPPQGPPNVMPFPNPLQSMPGATGLASGLQGGMTNTMNQAFGRPGGSG